MDQLESEPMTQGSDNELQDITCWQKERDDSDGNEHDPSVNPPELVVNSFQPSSPTPSPAPVQSTPPTPARQQRPRNGTSSAATSGWSTTLSPVDICGANTDHPNRSRRGLQPLSHRRDLLPHHTPVESLCEAGSWGEIWRLWETHHGGDKGFSWFNDSHGQDQPLASTGGVIPLSTMPQSQRISHSITSAAFSNLQTTLSCIWVWLRPTRQYERSWTECLSGLWHYTSRSVRIK